jgi:ribonuclease HI
MLFLAIKHSDDHLNRHNQKDSNDDNIMDIDPCSNLTFTSDISQNNLKKRKSFEHKGNQNKKNRQDIVSTTVGFDYMNDKNNSHIDSNEKNGQELNRESNARELNFLLNLEETLAELSLPINEIKFSTLTEQLQYLNLRTIRIIGDGNCFFRAISHQLFNNQNSHRELRSTATAHMVQNTNLYQAFIDEVYNDINYYIYRMKQNEEYADHLVIMAQRCPSRWEICRCRTAVISKN